MIRKKTSRAKLVAPWSDRGWYGEESRRRTPPEIREIIDREGRGRWNPVLYYDGRAAFAFSPAFHNPYFASAVGIGFVVFGVVVFNLMSDVVWAAVVVGGLFAVAGTLIATMNLRRIPSWHRARRAVTEYLATNDGRFPPELRWYT